MARCDNCNRFVNLDDIEAEEPVEEPTVEETGDVSVEVRVVRRSDCCGEEKQEYNFLLEGAPALPTDCVENPDGHTWELESAEAPEATDRYQTIDREGKPIKNPRYQKRLIGVEMQVTIKCRDCGNQETIELKGEAPASAFEEI